MLPPTNFVHLAHRVGWGAVLTLAAAALPSCSSEKSPISAASSKYQAAPDGPQQDEAGGSQDLARPSGSESPIAAPAPLQQQPPTAFSPPVAKPPAIASEELNVPPAVSPSAPPAASGGPDDLLQQLQKLDDEMRGLRMSGGAAGAGAGAGTQSPDALLAKLQQVLQAKSEVANKLLAAADLAPSARKTACRARLESLSALSSMRAEKADEELKAFAEKLGQDKDPDIARLAKLTLLGLRAKRLGEEQSEDPQAIVKEVKGQLAAKEVGEFEFASSQSTAMTLLRAGFHDEALETVRAIGEAFQGHADKRLAAGAVGLLDEAKVLDFQVRLRDVFQQKPESLPRLLQTAEVMLQGRADGGMLPMLAEAATNVEFSGEVDSAAALYALLTKYFASHTDQNLAQQAKYIVENFNRRVKLVGTALKIEGVLSDGAPLDWSKYQGKVVLVDFWATWCSPCIEELPNLEANYKRFHDQGFEIVGINVDDQRADAQRFLTNRPLPWATVFNSDPKGGGLTHPNAVQCGVEVIPFLVLIGRDGKVNALHVRGERLGEKLEELLAAPGALPPPKGAGAAPRPGG